MLQWLQLPTQCLHQLQKSKQEKLRLVKILLASKGRLSYFSMNKKPIQFWYLFNYLIRIVIATRQSRMTSSALPEKPSPEKKGVTMEAAKGRQLACASCQNIFDTRDSVVLHLLRQRRGLNGLLKCPFCAKKQVNGDDCFLEEVPKEEGNSRISKPKKTTAGSPLANRRASAGAPPENPTQADTLKSSLESEPRNIITQQQRHHVELAYKRAKNDDKDKSDEPVKVSVLINDSPSSESRLAVPKANEYKNGNICQYCGFVAGSFREVQFHINTHLAKSYPCEFCSHIYRSKQGVLKHIMRHHANQPNSSMNEGPEIASGGNKKRKLAVSEDDSGHQTASNFSDYSDSSPHSQDDSNSSFKGSFSSAGQLNSGALGGGGKGGQEQFFAPNTSFAPTPTFEQQHSIFMPGREQRVEKVLDLANF